MLNGAPLVPTKVFFTSGRGVHEEKLASFEMALRDAHIAQHNLVRVSSILPPRCEIVPRERGVELLHDGQILFCVLSEAATNEPNRQVGSTVGVAVPADRDRYGYISEHHAFGRSAEELGDYAEGLAASMLATTLGLPFDPDEAWDERVEHWKLSGRIVNTHNHTIVGAGPEDGRWLTTVAAAVFCG